MSKKPLTLRRAFSSVEEDHVSIEQESIYFHALQHDTAYWNFVRVRSFEGEIDINRFEDAVYHLLNDRPVLRSNFKLEGKRLSVTYDQHEDVGSYFEYVVCEDEVETEVKAIVDQELKRSPSYAYDPLIHIKLVSQGSSHYIILTVNHIICDLQSTNLIWSNLFGNYEQPPEPQRLAARPDVRRYGEYVGAQRAFLTGSSEVLDYWTNKLQLAHNPELPFKSVGEIKHTSKSFLIPEEQVVAIKKFAMKKRLLLSSFFMFAYILLLYKYSRNKQVSLVNVVDFRNLFQKRRYANSMGMFANRLVTHQDISDEQTVLEAMQDLSNCTLKEFTNYPVPLSYVNRQSEGIGFEPLAAFNFIRKIQDPKAKVSWNERALSPEIVPYIGEEQYDIYLYVSDMKDRMNLRFEVQCSPQMAGIEDHILLSYLDILDDCMLHFDQKIGDINSLRDASVQEVSALPETPGFLPVDQMFERQAMRSAQQSAIRFEGQSITYGQCADQVNSMQQYLLECGVGKGSKVGILLSRRPEIIYSILAVFQAGGCFVPIDPEFPKDRVDNMIHQAQMDLVIAESDTCGLVPSGIATLNVDEMSQREKVVASSNSQAVGLAYIIFTSGSTGNPKGVMIEHRALSNFVMGIHEHIRFEDRSVLSLTTISFDIFILETILPLCFGGTVLLTNNEQAKDPSEVLTLLEEEEIDILQVTPSRLRLLYGLQESVLEHVDHLIVGGEPFPADMLDKLRHTDLKIYNLYGPTETTVWSALKELTNEAQVTIGKPILNTEIFIIDEEHRPLPVGVVGEIAIAGEGVARGYLNDRHQTNARFYEDNQGRRVYKTGDKGRWLPNRDLQVLGRIDEQIKIRGYRVEVEEVEILLSRHDAIGRAVVVKTSQETQEELVACYTSDKVVSTTALVEFLKEKIPHYMVPDRFLQLSNIPMTPNNKVDRNKVRQLVSELRDKESGNQPMEEKMKAIWCRNLNIESWEDKFLHASFFHMGGHSMKVLSVIDEVRASYQVELTFKDFFASPKLKDLQDIILQRAS